MRHQSHSHQVLTRVRRIWNELDYAQRRMFEIRTGLDATGPSSRRLNDHQTEMLEDLYRRGWRH
jgi:hypothetical protein